MPPPPLIDRIQQLLPPVVVAGTTASLNTDALQVVLSPFVPAEIAGGHATTWASSAVVAALVAAAFAGVPPGSVAADTFAHLSDVAHAGAPDVGPAGPEAAAGDTAALALLDVGVQLAPVGVDAGPIVSGADVSIALGQSEAGLVQPGEIGTAPVSPADTAALIAVGPLDIAGPAGLEPQDVREGDIAAAGSDVAGDVAQQSGIGATPTVVFDGFAILPGIESIAGELAVQFNPAALPAEPATPEPRAELGAFEIAGLEDALHGQPQLRPIDWIITEIVWEAEPIGEDWEYLPEPLLPLPTYAAPGDIAPRYTPPEPGNDVPPIKPRPIRRRQVRVGGPSRGGVSQRDCYVEYNPDLSKPRRIICRKWKDWKPAGVVPPQQPPQQPPPPLQPPPPVFPPLPPSGPPPQGASPFPPLGQTPQAITWLSSPKNVGKLVKWGKWAWLAFKIVADDEDD